MRYNNEYWGDSKPISVDMRNSSMSEMGYPYFFNDKDEVIRLNNKGGIYDAYNYCPPLAAILGMASDAFTNAEFWALNSNTENDVIGQKKKWQDLLNQPNDWQDNTQFFKQLYTLRKLYGWTLVYKKRGLAFGSNAMLVLPNWMIRVEVKEKVSPLNNPLDAVELYLCFRGFEIKLSKSDLIFFSDNTVFTDIQTRLPQSRYLPQEKNINTIIGALDAGEELIRSKGALGILSTASSGSDQYALTALSTDEKKRIQQAYDKYGMTSGQYKMIITEAALRFQSMAFDVKQLGISDAIRDAIKGLCDATNFPFVLSAYSDQSTYNNVREAGKTLYQNNIVPDSKSIMRTLAKGLNADVDNVMFVANYDHVPVLQESKRDTGLGMKAINEAQQIAWKNNVITMNEWRVSLNMNKIPAEQGGDLYYREYISLYGTQTDTNGQAQSGQGQAASQQGEQSGGTQNQPNNN